MYIVFDIYYTKYIVYAHICTVQCECILQSPYAQHNASADPMRTQSTPGIQCTTPQCTPGLYCTLCMHAHIDTKSTSSDGTGAGQKEILNNKNTAKVTAPFNHLPPLPLALTKDFLPI